jgi:quinoprotein glucose dehydrogenase
VTQLTEAWNYPFRSFNTAVPIVVDGTMYLPAGNRVVALDADTGQEKWVYTIPAPAGAPAPAGGPGGPPGGPSASTRGVGYWPGDASTPAHILVMVGSKMLALDAANGQPSASFGQGGSIDVGVSYGGSVTVAEDVAIIGAATLENPIGVPGNPRAFDAKTGRKLWEFQTVPQAGQPYNETWGNGWKGRSGTNMWGFSAPVDLDRGIVILPLGSPSPNYWGGERPGANVYGNSIVAVDLHTGQYKWHFQTVHHDIWDTDQATAGALLDAGTGANRRPIIVSANKSSLVFEIDRETGKPFLPVEERAVPTGDVPGEYYSPTQPFPVNTPPLSRVSLTYDDIVDAEDTTPEHAKACRAMWDKAGGFLNYGRTRRSCSTPAGTPPRSTIQLPGGTGGVNWGGPAADPTTGSSTSTRRTPRWSAGSSAKERPELQLRLQQLRPAVRPRERRRQRAVLLVQRAAFGPVRRQRTPQGPQAPCYKPPWGELVAVNADTGAISLVGAARRDGRTARRPSPGRQLRAARTDGHRGRAGVRRRDQRPPLPRLRRSNRTAVVGDPAAR